MTKRTCARFLQMRKNSSMIDDIDIAIDLTDHPSTTITLDESHEQFKLNGFLMKCRITHKSHLIAPRQPMHLFCNNKYEFITGI